MHYRKENKPVSIFRSCELKLVVVSFQVVFYRDRKLLSERVRFFQTHAAPVLTRLPALFVCFLFVFVVRRKEVFGSRLFSKPLPFLFVSILVLLLPEFVRHSDHRYVPGKIKIII